MSEMTTLSSLMNKQAAMHPDAIAFVDGGWHVTYSEFSKLCDSTAIWLRRLGVRKGDKIALWLTNRVEWMVFLFACSRVGAVIMSVNTRFRSNELEYVLSQSAAKFLVMQKQVRSIDFELILNELDSTKFPYLQHIIYLSDNGATPKKILNISVSAFSLAGLQEIKGDGQEDFAEPDNLAILFTTSGTTKNPKFVMHTQQTIALHAQRAALGFCFNIKNAKTLGAVPFCGTFGQVIALASFAAAAPIIVMNVFDEKVAISMIHEYRITHLFGTEEMFRRLLSEYASSDVLLDSLYRCGFIYPTDLISVADKMKMPIVGLYGSSEVQGLFSCQPMALSLKERTLGGGRPVSPDAIVRVRDIQSGDIVQNGIRGELEIKAPTNFVGYLNNADATSAAIDLDGFFHTGDIGYIREDGTFVFEARMGDAIRLGGFLVNPMEIEEVIRAIPGVADAQVVGVSINEKLRAVAFVVLKENGCLREDDVIKFVKSHLADYKVPARVWFLNEFPVTKSANGDKIQKSKLRDIAISNILSNK